ncbi:MAG: hypothetical protein OEY14_05690, partial [Myxococcales bacterium]|nr:hypothetical protein [Myxococcales bacterium]
MRFSSIASGLTFLSLIAAFSVLPVAAGAQDEFDDEFDDQFGAPAPTAPAAPAPASPAAPSD